jgi:hypothetical protein
MSLQVEEPEQAKEPVGPESKPQVVQDKDPQETDELSEETLDEVSGGLIWQMSPTTGNGQYATPTSWTPKS